MVCEIVSWDESVRDQVLHDRNGGITEYCAGSPGTLNSTFLTGSEHMQVFGHSGHGDFLFLLRLTVPT